MGTCCERTQDFDTQQSRKKPKSIRAQQNSVDTEGIDHSMVFEQLRRESRNQSLKEKEEKYAQLISFKDKMKFKTVERFHSHYRILKELGRGAFGSVHLGEHRQSNIVCAIKKITKKSLRQASVYEELNRNEFEVLEETQHPNITRIFELMEDKANFYIVMEFISGGNLLEKIQQVQRFTMGQAARVVKQILLALNFMHAKNIMHRDLKAENIMVEENADNANDDEIYVKLTDFGFATRYEEGKQEELSLGSPLYMAPELCREDKYDNKVDVWAIGVISFVLLTGTPPFYDKSGRGKQGIYQSICRGEPDYSLLSSAGSDATDFIKSALKKQAEDRPSIDELLKHAWMVNHAEVNLDKDFELDISANLAAFAKTTTFQSAICSIIANMMSVNTDLQQINQMFIKWDTNKDGKLSFEELKHNIADISSFFSLTEPDVLHLLKKCDANNDGYIDYTEFLTAASNKRELLSEQNVIKAFKMLDADGDGMISRAELQSTFVGASIDGEDADEFWSKLIDDVDTDRDGQISEGEFRHHMMQVHRNRATFVQEIAKYGEQ